MKKERVSVGGLRLLRLFVIVVGDVGCRCGFGGYHSDGTIAAEEKHQAKLRLIKYM